MSVIAYTTYGAVRAVLGVDEIELKDIDLDHEYLSYSIDKALSSVSGVLSPDTEERTLAGHYDYINSLGVPTSTQSLFKSAITSYVTYIVAAEVGQSMSMFAPKTKSDGKALATRFSSEATFKTVMSGIYDKLMTIRNDITVMLGDTVSELTYMVIATPEDVVEADDAI